MSAAKDYKLLHPALGLHMLKIRARILASTSAASFLLVAQRECHGLYSESLTTTQRNVTSFMRVIVPVLSVAATSRFPAVLVPWCNKLGQ